MHNTILADISKIDSGLEALHAEGAKLRALQQQHVQEIADGEARVEAEYASTLEALSNADYSAESLYQQRLSAESDTEQQAEQSYRATVQKNSDAIRQKYDNFTRRDREYITDLENKCQIAAKNNAKLLQKYGAIPSTVTQKPNLTALFDLFDKIMTDTAESFMKRTFKKDGFYSQDAMIQDFISGSAKAISYLNYEINTVLPKDCNAELQKLLSTAQAGRQSVLNTTSASKQTAAQTKAAALRANEQKRQDAAQKRLRDLADLKHRQQAYITDENAKIWAASQKKDAFFETELVTQFSRRAERALTDSGVTAQDWTGYRIDRSAARYFAWGNIHVPIHTDSKPLQTLLMRKIPAYCKGSYFSVPLLMETESVTKLYLQYDSATKGEAYRNIQSYILQKLRSNPANHLNVYFADPNDRGQNMGVLIATAQENAAIGIQSQNTKDGIRQLLKEIVEQIDQLGGELGGYPSLFAYNRSSGKRLKETLLVLCDVQNCIEPETLPLLKVIWQNAARCGINVLLTSQSPGTQLDQHYPNAKMDWSFLSGRDAYYIQSGKSGKTIRYGQESYPYEVSALPPYCARFVEDFRQHYAESLKIDNRFNSLRSRLTLPALTEDQRRYGKAYNGICLPIMLDTTKNSVCQEFIIGTENSQHTLITGGTGSGKSRFLQMIISSIILNYHPDDVELWLIDCKKVEFKKFLDLRPQHVRLVSLERTQDFTFAFFDYLLDFAQKRTREFMSCGVTNIKDYRKVKNDPYCMPRVVIIIDEFHAITTNVNTDLKYRQLLEDALAEYRNLGISFLFSDQSVSGLKGLTDKGRQQLHNRVAMKNSISEMKETLQLLSDNYLPETLMQMEKSEGYGDFWWNRNPNTRYKNVFIDDRTEEELIREVIARGQTATQDTKVILVDGNERNRFEESKVAGQMQFERPSGRGASALPFYVGAPTTLEESFSFKLVPKYNQNVLITGRDTQMTVDVIASMLRSARLAGDTRIIVLADSMDDRYQILQGSSALSSGEGTIEVYEEYSQICQVIYSLHTAIKAKRPLERRTLVIWLGLPDMYDEFCVSPPKPASMEPLSKADQAKKSGGFVVEDPSLVLGDPQLMELAGEIGEGMADILSFLSIPDEEPEQEEKDDLCYNATQDVYDLLAMGGKYGLFHAVSLEYSHDARRIKGFNISNFIHKIAFSMSRDESVEWGFRTAAAELVEGLTALYSDGINQVVFRPYTNLN